MDENIESMRQLLELALSSGRKLKSAQTGYLHYSSNIAKNEPHLPIPLMENFLFVLALLKSRVIENIQEAKTMLEGLLHFQNKNNHDLAYGNFPLYMHEYPACNDRYSAIHIACVFIQILKQFSQILGQDLKKKLVESLFLCFQQAFRAHSEKNAPFPVAIKIACVSILTGQIITDEELIDRGEQMLETLKDNFDETYFYIPAALGSITVTLLMVYPRLSESPWKFIWNYLQNTWHRGIASYAGPGLKEWQQKEEPQVTLYDLVCGYFSDAFSGRSFKERPLHLEAMLITVTDDRFRVMEYPLEIQGKIKGAKWLLHLEDCFAYSYIEKAHIELKPGYEKGFYPFKLLWGNKQRAHTFVCQGGDAIAINFESNEIIFHLEGNGEFEDREKAREIQFFLDVDQEQEFLVSDQKASTFTMQDVVIIKDKQLELDLSFEVLEGEGRFFGHRMLGNRPAQLENKGEARFDAYDWQVFLRTLNRSEKCRVKIKWALRTCS